MVEWIKELIFVTISDWIIGFIENVFNAAYEYITVLVVQPTEPGKYLTNFSEYLKLAQYLAGGLLVIFVILAVFRQISGVMYQDNKSMGTYFIHVTVAGGLIYILPKLVTVVFLPINKALIDFIGEIGIDVSDMANPLKFIPVIAGSSLYSIMCMILGIALIVLCIAGAIRYIETLLAILIAPLAAISVINNSDGLQIWIREVIAIVFTQTIHFLILQIFLSIMGGVANTMLMFVLSIGTIAVGLKGPQVLRQYLYKTGTSSAMVSTVGSVGRLGMMSVMTKR